MQEEFVDNGSAIDLAGLDADFERATSDGTGVPAGVPDGKYQIVVEHVELTKTPTTGNPMLKWLLRIVGPRLAGRTLRKNNVLTANTVGFLKAELHLCGIELGKLSELPRHLDELVNIRLEVTKRTKGEFDNVFFNRRLSLTEASEVTDNDLPF
jgi:hypothetical protein